MKDLGQLHYLLGTKAHSHNGGLFFPQQKYTLDLFQETNMSNVKTVSNTSLTYSLKLFDNDLFHDPTLYCSTVGAL